VRALTPAERRGLVIVAGLFVLGAVHDLVRTRHMSLAPPPDRLQAAGLRPEPPADPPGPVPAPGTIDLNTADEDGLRALDGIGPTLARRIVEHRRVNGPFRSVDELAAVRGIGPALLRRIGPRVRVGDPAQPGASRRPGQSATETPAPRAPDGP